MAPHELEGYLLELIFLSHHRLQWGCVVLGSAVWLPFVSTAGLAINKA